MELLTVRELSFSYPGAAHKALKEISFTVNEGELVLVCGPSGSGKSTLLEGIKPELRRNGTRSGAIAYKGRSIDTLDRLETACDIGFVMQDVESQLVTETVRSELCFGLESLGFPPEVIRRRVAEMASFFGLGRLLDKNVNTLSGGEKQTVNLASVLALSPRLLLLDEPTSQLDPVAAREFLSMLVRLNREMGLTVMIAEHRTEELFAMCGRVMVLEAGRLRCDGDARTTAQWMARQQTPFSLLLPSAARIFPWQQPMPLTVAEGRALFEQRMQGKPPPALQPYRDTAHQEGAAAVKVKGVYFGYNGARELIFRDMDFSAHEREITAVMGDNGSGKTTLLKLLCGLARPNKGRVTLFGEKRAVKAAYLPQNTRILFVEDRIIDDLLQTARGLDTQHAQETVRALADELAIGHILNSHPFDVSEGERQRAALAKVLLARPRLLLLDEPTKALDPAAKEQLAGVLKTLAAQGVTIIMASHDAPFCAQHCDRCALLFDGGVACCAPPRAFFGGNAFYTTQASLIASGYSRQAVTCEEVHRLWEE
ncbi:MAG: ABC transporter ATP-binding protein [Acetanaerobacterium sp.]